MGKRSWLFQIFFPSARGRGSFPGPVCLCVNDQLTKHRQNLLFAARKLVKSKKLFAAWAQQGNILIRETESGKIIQVRDHSELKGITSKEESLNHVDSIEMFRGNSSQSSDDRLSIMTHISNYEYYYDSDL